MANPISKRYLVKTSLHDLPDANEMVARLVQDHEQIIRNLREDVDKCSEEYHDEGTADFLTELMEQHEEMAWMLRSFLEGDRVVPSGDRPNAETKPSVNA